MIEVCTWNTKSLFGKMYQITALKDIPSKGVKAGDLGGYVSNSNTLSQEGDCWISKNSKVYGNVIVRGNAHINEAIISCCTLPEMRLRGFSVIVNDNAVISNNAFICRDDNGATQISGNAIIKNSAILYNVAIVKDNAIIDGDVRLGLNSKIIHNAKILGNSIVGENAQICGTAIIKDFAEVMKNAIVESATVSGYTVVPQGNYVNKKSIDTVTSNPESTSNLADTPLEDVLAEDDITLLNIIEKKIAVYQEDVVNLIKFPLMNDLTDTHTLAMTVTHQKALRAKDSKNVSLFHTLVETLEEKFLMAESHAHTVSLSRFTPTDKRKIVKSQDLLSIVIDTAAAPQEKKAAYKQVCHNLEGLIAIPPLAIKALSQRSGLLEIEM